MKGTILFALLSFSCLFYLNSAMCTEEIPCLFYMEPATYTGDIPCEITFYSHLNQETQKIPFTYETDCELSHLEIEIFDQWGEHIYSTDDVNLEWYGQKEVEDEEGDKEIMLLPEGTYYYVAQYQFNGNSALFKADGSIMVQL